MAVPVTCGEIASGGAAAAAVAPPPAEVLWVATMACGGRLWPLGEDSDWGMARLKYGGHADYGMVQNAEARACFRKPDGGKFHKHVFEMKKDTEATFTLNGWTTTLRKIGHAVHVPPLPAPLDAVAWVATLECGGQQWLLVENTAWWAVFDQYCGHMAYEMIQDQEVRTCFMNPARGAFSRYCSKIKEYDEASFAMNGWTVALKKVTQVAAAAAAHAALSPPLTPSGARHPPVPTCGTCRKYGQPEVGSEAWVQGSVFMCAACSPSKLALYAPPPIDPSDALRAERDAAAKTYGEAYEALMQEGRVKEDFTAKMVGLANDFVKAALAMEKATTAFELFTGTNTDTDAGAKRRRA